ncbi:MAG: response regulator [Candidatus Helarchaeota archaeon]
MVEDEPSLQNLYEWILERSGHVVIGIAKDGEEAVKKYKSLPRKPEIIIMDHRMPNKSGLEAMKEIREIDTTSMIIFASADMSVKEIALRSGAASFITKPFNFKLLLTKIEHLIRNNH